MSRSKIRANNDKGFFCAWACYSSNKKAKRESNQKFRTVSKRFLKKLINSNDFENDDLIYRQREVSDVWNFPSDGLAQYIKYDNKWTKEEIERNKRK